MNIFYDDLFCKENIDDINFFAQKGFNIERSDIIKSMTIDEIYGNLYAYLDDYKNFGFKFINFPDEVVRFSKNKEIFYCFGKSLTGYFLINDNGNIYTINNKYHSENLYYEYCFSKNHEDNIDEALLNKYEKLFNEGVFIQYVNKNLLDFLNSYSYYLSSIYAIKGAFKAYNQSLSSVAKIEANILEERLLNIDASIMTDYSFWGNALADLRSVNVALSFQLAPYKLTGRL